MKVYMFLDFQCQSWLSLSLALFRGLVSNSILEKLHPFVLKHGELPNGGTNHASCMTLVCQTWEDSLGEDNPFKKKKKKRKCCWPKVTTLILSTEKPNHRILTWKNVMILIFSLSTCNS